MLRWRGVHIEASPSSFKKLALNRPDQINVHVAVCDKTRVVHFVEDRRVAVSRGGRVASTGGVGCRHGHAFRLSTSLTPTPPCFQSPRARSAGGCPGVAGRCTNAAPTVQPLLDQRGGALPLIPLLLGFCFLCPLTPPPRPFRSKASMK